MNKRELIDKAIEQFGGKYPAGFPENVFLSYRDGCKEKNNKYYPFYVGYAESEYDICTKDEFKQRARELGWINGYKYGVEYKINGKKPDLPDDVFIKGHYSFVNIEEAAPVSVKNASWGMISKFRIVDELYKPVSEISENQQNVSVLPENNQKTENVSDWHEKGELPPIGSIVDVIGDVMYGAGEVNCEVIAHVENCAVIRMSYGLGCFESHCLKPAKTEREKFVEDAFIVAEKEGRANYKLIFAALFDAGFRAPK